MTQLHTTNIRRFGGTLLIGFFAVFGLAHAATPVEVPVARVSATSVSSGYEVDGVVEPVHQSTISAQTAGRVSSLLVKAGDAVRAGQLLATIDDRETQSGVQRSQAQVAQSEAELLNAKANAQRTKDLQAQGFVSMAALDTANAQLKAMQAGRDQAVAVARQSALAQGFTRVTAPYDGWVQQTLSEAGDLAVPGKPLLTLYAPSPLRAVVHVPASRAEVARNASAVEVQTPDGIGGQRWVTPTSRAALPTTDPISQTIEWRFDLPNEVSRHISPGQQLTVRFAGGSASRMVVPGAAVIRRGELTAVYVATEGNGTPGTSGFRLRAVRLGADHGPTGVEVLAGLFEGERVALDPVRAGLEGARASDGTR